MRLETAVGRHLTVAASELSGAIDDLKTVIQAAPRELEVVIDQVKRALAEIARATEPLHEHAERLARASEQLTSSVEASAATWDYALGQFKTIVVALDEASTRLEPAARHVAEVSAGLDASAQAVTAAAAGLNEASAPIERLRQVIDKLGEQFETEVHQRDALVAAVEAAAGQLQSAQRSIDEFLGDLERGLARALGAFADGLRTTSDRTYEQFSGHLSNAISTLAGAIDELQTLVEETLHPTVRAIAERSEPAVGDAERGIA